MRSKLDSAFFRMLLALVLVLVGGTSADAQCNPKQIAKLLADDGASEDWFGDSVAIDRTTAIVAARGDDDNGNRSGSAYLFDTTTGQQIAKLLTDDGAEDDFLGPSVSISGTTAIVGCSQDDDNGDLSGSAYLFDTKTGQQIAKLLPGDGGSPVDNFGNSVGVSGTTAIVGVPFDDDNGDDSGSAYLFDTTTGQQTFKLLPDDGAAGDDFGRRVAIHGTTAIVTADRDDDNGSHSGSAYLFDITTGQQIAKLLPNDGAADDVFGSSVSISGTTAVVGAWRDDDNGESSGSAYVFDIATGQQTFKLLPDDGAAGDRFGASFSSISGSTAIVGALYDDDNGSGSGSAYLFDITTGKQIAKLLPNDGAADDRFGYVSISGSTAIVGARYDDDNGENSGSVYLFDVSDVNCAEVVIADSFLVTRGTYVSGGVAELAESDNMDLSIQRSNSDIQSRTEFEVKAVSPVASPSSLEVTLEGSVFARSQVDQTIDLFDYVAGGWEQVDSRAATRFTDSTITVSPTGDLSRFVEAGTMCIKARIRYQSPVARQRFSSNTDQFVWTIGQ